MLLCLMVEVDECIRIESRSRMPSDFAPEGRLFVDFLADFLLLLDLLLLLRFLLLLDFLLLPDSLGLFLDAMLFFDLGLLLLDF